MSLDLKLDPLTHDLEYTDYDLVITDEKEQLIQNLKIRLLFFLGEWFLDVTRGVPYFEEILIKNPNQARVESILKEQILETENVNEMLEFNLNYDNINRVLSVRFSVDTTFGIIDLTEELPT